MLFVLQVLPLTLYFLVGLHLHIGLAPLEAILLIDGDEVVEQQGVGTFLLVFRQNADKHQVQTFGFVELQRLQTVPPAKGPQILVIEIPTPITSWLGVFQSSMRQSMSMSNMGKYIFRYSSIWRSVICE